MSLEKKLKKLLSIEKITWILPNSYCIYIINYNTKSTCDEVRTLYSIMHWCVYYFYIFIALLYVIILRPKISICLLVNITNVAIFIYIYIYIRVYTNIYFSDGEILSRHVFAFIMKQQGTCMKYHINEWKPKRDGRSSNLRRCYWHGP